MGAVCLVQDSGFKMFISIFFLFLRVLSALCDKLFPLI